MPPIGGSDFAYIGAFPCFVERAVRVCRGSKHRFNLHTAIRSVHGLIVCLHIVGTSWRSRLDRMAKRNAIGKELQRGWSENRPDALGMRQQFCSQRREQVK